MSTKLIITQGLPASGKTTWARERATADKSIEIICADDLRYNLFKKRGYLGPEKEAVVRDLEVSRATFLLKRDRTVIICDTNLNPQTVKMWKRLAQFNQVPFEIKSFMHVPLSVCIKRDELRPTLERAGAERITKMYNSWKSKMKGNI